MLQLAQQAVFAGWMSEESLCPCPCNRYSSAPSCQYTGARAHTIGTTAHACDSKSYTCVNADAHILARARTHVFQHLLEGATYAGDRHRYVLAGRNLHAQPSCRHDAITNWHVSLYGHHGIMLSTKRDCGMLRLCVRSIRVQRCARFPRGAQATSHRQPTLCPARVAQARRARSVLPLRSQSSPMQMWKGAPRPGANGGDVGGVSLVSGQIRPPSSQCGDWRRSCGERRPLSAAVWPPALTVKPLTHTSAMRAHAHM